MSALTDEQLTWVGERMPSAGRLTTAEDAEGAYWLRRQHTPYSTLTEVFACSRASLQRAIRLVAAVRGDDPVQWVSIRRARRRRAVASFWAHAKRLTVRRQTIADEIREVRRANGIEMPEPLPPGPRDAFAEQERLTLDAHGRAPSPPSKFPSRLTPARAPRNPFERT
jgi:hypothetical protein